MPDQPRHLAAPRDPDGRMVAILVAGFAAALLLGGMLGDLNATPRGRAPAVTVGAIAPPTTGGVAGRRAGDVGKTPPPTVRYPVASWRFRSDNRTAGPDPGSIDLGSSTTAPASSSSSTPTTAAPASSSTVPPETSRGSDEAGPTPSSTTGSSTVPPSSTPEPTVPEGGP